MILFSISLFNVKYCHVFMSSGILLNTVGAMSKNLVTINAPVWVQTPDLLRYDIHKSQPPPLGHHCSKQS